MNTLKLWKQALLVVSLTLLLFMAACSGSEDVDGAQENETVESGQEDASEEDAVGGESDDEGSDSEEAVEEDPTDGTDEAEKPQAYKPSDETYNDEISFRRVNWFGTPPLVHDKAGIWLYTEENHPPALETNFNWEESDVLEWQIANEELFKYKMTTKTLELIDDDIVKIIVEVGDEENSQTRKERRNQNHLIVDKGVLDGMSFIIETTDGQTLSLSDED